MGAARPAPSSVRAADAISRALRPPRSRFVAALAAAIVLGVLLGVRLVVDYDDLTCPAGTAVRYHSVASWTAYCAPVEGAGGPTIVPIRRYVGLFLQNVDVRLFDADFDNIHGPAFGVRLGR